MTLGLWHKEIYFIELLMIITELYFCVFYISLFFSIFSPIKWWLFLKQLSKKVFIINEAIDNTINILNHFLSVLSNHHTLYNAQDMTKYLTSILTKKIINHTFLYKWYIQHVIMLAIRWFLFWKYAYMHIISFAHGVQ